MGLREQAADDVRRILESKDSGFGWDVTLIAPDGQSAALTGYSTDIHLLLDPDTGQTVSGRAVEASLPMAAIAEKGIGTPTGEVRRAQRPWTIELNDIAGNPHKLKVIETHPDNALGVVVIRLEAYTDGG